MNERTTVRLPPELLKRAKRKAAADGRTLTAMIEEGLRRILNDRGEGQKRVPVPISKARGGPRIPDAWLAALAIEHGCTFVTLVRDFARFPGLSWQQPG